MSYKYNVFTGKLDYYTTASGGTGQTNTMTNLGAGEGIYFQKVGVDFEMKSLIGGDNITLISDNNEITISGGGGGISDHSLLSNLDYASAGHTGFQASGDYVTDTEMTTISGDILTVAAADVDADIITFSGTIDHDTIINNHNLTTDIDHNQLTNYLVGEHRTIDDAGSSATDLWSAEKINTVSGALNDKITTENLWDRSGTDISPHTSGDTISGTGNLHIDGTSQFDDDVSIAGESVDNHYEIIYIDAGAMIPCTNSGALGGTSEYTTNDIDLDYFAFDSGAIEERVQFKLSMVEGWDRSTIKAKFFWSSDTGSTSGDTCQWGIKGQACTNSDAIDVAFGDGGEVIGDVLLADNGADWQLSSATPAITIGGTPALMDMLVFEIWRDTSVDNMAEDGWLFGVLIQYKVNNSVAAW